MDDIPLRYFLICVFKAHRIIVKPHSQYSQSHGKSLPDLHFQCLSHTLSNVIFFELTDEAILHAY